MSVEKVTSQIITINFLLNSLKLYEILAKKSALRADFLLAPAECCSLRSQMVSLRSTMRGFAPHEFTKYPPSPMVTIINGGDERTHEHKFWKFWILLTNKRTYMVAFYK